MYHHSLNINGIEYKLAVNLTGKGEPTSATNASVGMFYMDEDSGEVYKRTVSGWERFISIVETHTLQEAKDYADSLLDNIYDLVITSDEEFSKCLYALDGGSANTEFEHTNVLVKDVVFKIQHGSSDLDLHIFQPSIKYIKFENCRWETEWWVSGKVPTTLATGGTQYKRAEGDLDLVIDGIEVTADNVQAAKDADTYWYIGLRNIKALINSTVRYPEGYDIGNGWNFKLTCQYFDYASNNHVSALWDGANVSDCYITEKLVRCKGCVNIVSAPVMKNGVLNNVAVQSCTFISNFSGDFSYSSCTEVVFTTCEGYKLTSNYWGGTAIHAQNNDGRNLVLYAKTASGGNFIPQRDGNGNIQLPTTQTADNQALSLAYAKTIFPDVEKFEELSARGKPYDYIVRNMTELREVLTKSLTGRRILLRDFTINTADTLDFKWAGYVGFSNMLFGADINLANAWELDGAGLDASNNKWSVTVEGAGRSRVRNFGRLPGASTESKYTFKKCRLVTGCIVGEATECSAIHGCYISLNADVVISGCTDVCGLTVVPSGRTATTTLSGCKNVSHISNKGSGSIIYNNCTNVDYFTCDGFGDGKIPSTYLPSYVDDIVEVYHATAGSQMCYKDAGMTLPIFPESGKIYVCINGTNKNKCYRWGGVDSGLVEISASLALGETSSTAFPGDRGLALEKKVDEFGEAGNALTALHIEAHTYDYANDAVPVLPTALEGKAFLLKGKAYFNARFTSDNVYHEITVDFCLPFLTSTIFDEFSTLGVTRSTGVSPEPIGVFVKGTSSGLSISLGGTTELYGYEYINRIDLDVLVLGSISE